MKKSTKSMVSFLLCGTIALSVVAGVSAGWKKSETNGKWWYERTDKSYPAGQFEEIGGKWYLFDGSGFMKTGWQESGGKWYYFDDTGAMLTGWLEQDKKRYYLNENGAMVTGKYPIDGLYHLFSDNGVFRNLFDGTTQTDGWIRYEVYLENFAEALEGIEKGYIKKDGLGDYWIDPEHYVMYEENLTVWQY